MRCWRFHSFDWTEAEKRPEKRRNTRLLCIYQPAFIRTRRRVAWKVSTLYPMDIIHLPFWWLACWLAWHGIPKRKLNGGAAPRHGTKRGLRISHWIEGLVLCTGNKWWHASLNSIKLDSYTNEEWAELRCWIKTILGLINFVTISISIEYRS